MKFTTATFITLGLLAGNVISAPTSQINDVAVPVEARAADFEASHLEARKKKKGGKGKKKDEKRDFDGLEVRDAEVTDLEVRDAEGDNVAHLEARKRKRKGGKGKKKGGKRDVDDLETRDAEGDNFSHLEARKDKKGRKPSKVDNAIAGLATADIP
ncbi:hypothetical protein LZ32DRAFT_652346 [Colletotrichum eremochloae]|nr:hypothetical protein LZ32DRAFT_652346 [Colletotrichum eremochloae]